MDVVATRADAAALDRPPLIVLDSLASFMDDAGLGDGPVTATPIGDGHSNVTQVIARGQARWVLRRPPRGPLPPSAHDVLREARIIRALERTNVPVPRIVAECADPEVIGAPFCLMEYVDGHVVTDALPPVLSNPAARRQVGTQLIGTLAAIHDVDCEANGLDQLGRDDGRYLARQLKRFSGLLEKTQTRALPRADQVARWLRASMPDAGPTTLVHGDYRLGNLILDDRSASPVAVLDWEMATRGDPLADLGYLTATWQRATVFDPDPVACAPGFPDAGTLAQRYSELRSVSIRALGWYEVLALWKFAIFMEGNYRRALSGSTDDAHLKLGREGVPQLLELALERAGAVS